MEWRKMPGGRWYAFSQRFGRVMITKDPRSKKYFLMTDPSIGYPVGLGQHDSLESAKQAAETEKNPGRKRHSAKWDRCVSDVKKSGTAKDPYAVCTSSIGRKSYMNPRFFILVAQKDGGKMLKYLGGVKFGTSGTAVLFKTSDSALVVGRMLKLQFPLLKKYKLRAISNA
ncbi:MAG: hypothetical protein ACREAC_07265 [Blastocatellia bacterium]